MMKFKNKRIPLSKLVLHPANVRGQQGYDENGIEALACMIERQGHIAPLMVQPLDGEKDGVLAGGRRLRAFELLEATGRLADNMIDCRLVPKDVPAETAISLAENISQEPMNPVDAYDAFAAMVEQGLSVEDISKEFGIEVRTVQERLRYGRVHPTIRDAARAGEISLDALKAFAAHPSQDAQLRVFEGLSETGNVQAWTVRSRLKEASIQMGDTLGQFVGDVYRRKGGELEEALFPEETVLLDRSLAEEIAADELHTLAAQVADEHGFGWAESRLSMDYGAFSAYGRIYPRYEDPSKEDEARLAEINHEREKLYDAEVGDPAAHDDTTKKISELDREAEAIDQSLQRYDPEKAKKAGVIVSLGRNGPEVHAGLIKPDDQTSKDVDDDDKKTNVASLTKALQEDLCVERADAIAAAVLDQAQLAHDALLFAIAVQTLSQGCRLRGIELQCRSADRRHSRPHAREICDLEAVEERHGVLDLTWLDDDLSERDRFVAYRALDPEMKGKIAAWCLGAVLVPDLASSDDDSFVQAVAAVALPDIRVRWTPKFDNVWDRVRKPYMLRVLEEVGLGDDAAAMRTARKGALAKHMETLFARPFKTLTKTQRAAVDAWTPEGMATVRPTADDEQETAPKAAA